MANLDDWIVVFGGHGAAGPAAPVGRARRTELQHLPVCLVDVTLEPIGYAECGTIVFENISPGGLNDLWKAKINIYEPFVVNLARQGAPYRE
jgi:hypothetical protein